MLLVPVIIKPMTMRMLPNPNVANPPLRFLSLEFDYYNIQSLFCLELDLSYSDQGYIHIEMLSKARDCGRLKLIRQFQMPSMPNPRNNTLV